ncbi:DUF2975 domain-containing protein [Helcococcus sueciensis]|uniref:DUF2975 domain-containing protein n=1 Tax=Helcococcus sueciensis TaxID=241555 RepID=UPI0003F61E8F|nr:DUF2975 domain-containing protein [Helcococcus sueciensis]
MSSNLLDKKMKKSIYSLKYLAIIFIVLVAIACIFVTYQAVKDLSYFPELKRYVYPWLAIGYTVSFMIVWGILDVLKLMNNLLAGKIFTFDNANLIKVIDKKLVVTLIFTIIANIVMLLLDITHPSLMILWFGFILFILAAHIIVKPLSLLVEKSAELQIEMELTI